jgi:hypothetical protein
MALIDPDENDADGRTIGAWGRSLVTEGGAVHNRCEFVVDKPKASLGEVSPEAARRESGATHVNPGKSLNLVCPCWRKYRGEGHEIVWPDPTSIPLDFSRR